MTIKAGIKSPKKKKLKKKVKKPVVKVPQVAKKTIKKVTPKIAQTVDDVSVDTSPTVEKKKRGRPKKTEIKVSIKSETLDLTEKEERFCREYVCDAALNATKSYQRAFPATTYNTASTEASLLLKKPEIRARLNEMKIERAARLEITPERILNEIAKQAFYDPRAFYDEDGRLKPVSELDPDVAAVICNMETIHKVSGDESDGMTVLTKIKLPDKRANLELLGRFTKTFDPNAPSPDKRVAKLINEAMHGKISARDAAMQIQIIGAPIPEVLKIEMIKLSDDATSHEAEALTPDSLERKYREAIEEKERQMIEFIPERKESVEAIKLSLEKNASFQPIEDVAVAL